MSHVDTTKNYLQVCNRGIDSISTSSDLLRFNITYNLRSGFKIDVLNGEKELKYWIKVTRRRRPPPLHAM